MSDHRPECFYYMDDFGDGERCICDRLRACERRVLDAAREALTAVENDPDAEIDYDRDYMADPSGNTRNPRMWLRHALAAIDALRGSGNPDTPPSAEKGEKP